MSAGSLRFSVIAFSCRRPFSSSFLSLDAELVTKINSHLLSLPLADVQGLPTSQRPSGKAVCFFFCFFLSFAQATLAGKMSCIFSAGCAEMLNGRTQRRAHASERLRSSCSDSRLMRHPARPPLRLSAAELELDEQGLRITANVCLCSCASSVDKAVTIPAPWAATAELQPESRVVVTTAHNQTRT